MKTKIKIVLPLLAVLMSGEIQAQDQDTEQCSEENIYACMNQFYQAAVINEFSEDQLMFAENQYAQGSAAKRSGPAASGGTFIFDPKRLKWAAYDSSGELVGAGKASGGSHYCADINRGCRTPVGRFRVYRKGPVECRSKTYPVGVGGGYMPYCMFFTGGYAVHGHSDVPSFNASHGCIRVRHSAARWLYTSFMKPGTNVVVLPYN